jgi:hypothetical protein
MQVLSNRHLFWDTDVNTIDIHKHKEAIIERVVERGSWKEFKEILQFYGRDDVIATLKKVRWLSDKTMHFVSGYFEIPLEKLRCYTQRQSSPKHYL